MVKKVYSIKWFNEYFRVRIDHDTGKFVCRGTVNGYDYSFEDYSNTGARAKALAYLQLNGHVEQATQISQK